LGGGLESAHEVSILTNRGRGKKRGAPNRNIVVHKKRLGGRAEVRKGGKKQNPMNKKSTKQTQLQYKTERTDHRTTYFQALITDLY